MGVAVGIDLGTTNTVVAVVRDGQPVTLADEGGRKLIPSFVAFHPSGKVLVGESAKDRRVVDPSNTIYSVKRLIGRTFPSDEVQRAIKAMPFEIVEGEKQGVRVVARGEVYTLPEISAFVLRRAKAVAEAAIGEIVDKAVITVPANFNDPQRAATKLAGKLAGLEVLRILNEPTAAALAYGQTAGKAERIAVYDLGGGTFDVTLLDLSGEVFEVLATGGDTALGGDDVDQAIAAEMTTFFLQKYRFDPRPDPTARALLRSRAEKLKHALSERMEASIDMNDVVRGEGGAFVPATFSMDRKKLETIANPLIDRTIETCRFSIETIGLDPAEIERILLVGGATRMPLVVRRVEEYFQKPTGTKVNPDEVVAQGAAVQAAALTKVQTKAPEKSMRRGGTGGQPAISAGAFAMGIGDPIPDFGKKPAQAKVPEPARAPAAAPAPIGRVPLVRREVPREPPPAQPAAAAAPPSPESSSPISFDFDLDVPSSKPAAAPPPPKPREERQVIRALRGANAPLPRGDDEEDVPPVFPNKPPPRVERAELDFPVLPPPAAALPPPDIVPEPLRPIADAPAPRAAPLLIDVTPISLGVEVAGGFCDFLIRANTPVPCDRTRVFRTASDNQVAVRVRVIQGESERFSENTYLGDLELSGLRAAPRGEVAVGVTFEIDADGILNVRAKEEGTGRETVARMNLLGAQTDTEEVAAMMARQRKHEVA
jgi:molecular chaperone DnaK